MVEKSPWADSIGPLYAESGLSRRGIHETSELISIITTEGTQLYPQNQFDIVEDSSLDAGERLVPREKVLELWNTILRPAILEGIGDAYTFSAHIFHANPPKLSMSDQIAANPDNFDYISTRLKRLVYHWSH